MMTIKERYQLLNKVSLLKNLSRSTLVKVSELAKFNSYGRGEEIFSKNSAGESLYVLVSGRVKIYSTVGTHTKTFALLDSGDFFGEMALLGEPIRSASARAVMDSELLVLHRSDFQKFLKDDSFLTIRVLKTLCERLRQADKEIEMLSFQNVVGRTAITLFDLAGKYGKPASNGTLIDAEITQTELADLIGTVREMVSRVIARFKRIKAIDFERSSGKIVILDSEKLKSCIYQ